ncbi:UDP-glucuronosyl/UDP-glucosyltransferase [Corchorus olitorius]|uniref:UDP-glucuronosyl/UDP-glucosyltransferase n=1 Tax=Corchorus olitorius TaxID=93759 RepID=A0A1R3HHV9_9ROSI|nr:UDP-glucuronosyl/UDP-glucosyltransferase [Corchorus olitorius]
MANAGVHLLVYPFPGAGHIIPFLDLTHRLLNRGLTVTVLVTPNNLHLLDQLLSRHASSSLHPLVLPAPDPPAKFGLIPRMRALRELHYPLLLHWFHSHASPPVTIISDFFLGWTLSLASELGVPRFVFSPSGAFSISLNFLMCREPPRIDDPDDVDHIVSFPGLPNSPEFPCHQITLMYRYLKDGDPEKEYYRDNWFANLKSWGFVLNTCSHLESIYIDHIKKEMGHDRVWAVGPLMVPDEDGDGDGAMDLRNRGGSSSVPCQELMAWLDAREYGSVVYVSFGSHQVLNRMQTDELAAGLEKSGVNFVWSVREPRDGQVGGDHGVIPVGFEDRVAGKGFLIKGWAPQVAILKHRAVGAFLTHCGWNSTLEGVAAGVVMLTWPMGADQFTNTKLLVDQWGIGIRVGESTHNIPDSRKLARVLVESLDASRPEKDRAKKLSEAALAAVKGGSSHKDLESLVKTVKELKAHSHYSG